MTLIVYESIDQNTIVYDYDDKVCIQTFSTGGWMGRGGGFLDRHDVERLIQNLSKWLNENKENENGDE